MCPKNLILSGAKIFTAYILVVVFRNFFGQHQKDLENLIWTLVQEMYCLFSAASQAKDQKCNIVITYFSSGTSLSYLTFTGPCFGNTQSRPRGSYRTHTFQRGKNMLITVLATCVPQDPYFLHLVKATGSIVFLLFHHRFDTCNSSYERMCLWLESA